MTAHPNRSTWRSSLPVPTPEEVRALRVAAGLTQADAAEVAGLAGWRQWAGWESGERRPSAQSWELLLLRLGRHPRYILLERRGRAEQEEE